MDNKFSENLKKIRKEHNLSQEQLADELGVSRQAISKWESSQAYPEMDKIIALCNKFDLNIDDLLHRDIKEVKSEEESKKSINKYIDDFLKFITDTINMFSYMDFKSKIKCLIEQILIAFVLFLVSSIIINITSLLFFNIFRFLPTNANNIISNILSSLVTIFCFIVSVIILAHVFKTRYLDYYDNITKNNKEEINNEIIPEEENTLNANKEKNYVKNEEKVIIRDPKHSEYRFINGLFTAIVIIIKFFCALLAISTSCVLIGLFITFVSAFLIAKTGLFFIGLLLTILSAIIISIIILLLLLNFIFNRKNDKKKMIWSFILSLITLGAGIGLTASSIINFDIDYSGQTLLETKKLEFDMKDNYFFTNEVTYIEKDIKNIVIEYQINKYCELYQYENEGEGLSFGSDCSNPEKAIREVIKELNKKRIIGINDAPVDMKVYASKENINLLKKNLKKYFDKIDREQIEADNYEERISSLEEELNEYREKVAEYEDRLAELDGE